LEVTTMNAQPPADARYTVELTRRGNHWTAELEGGDLVDVDLIPDTPVYGIDVTGTVDTTNGPGWALEQVGQTLDAREAQRLTVAHGFQELLDYVAPAPALDEAVERVVEVLEDHQGRGSSAAGWLGAVHIARAAWPDDVAGGLDRARHALERAEVAGLVEHDLDHPGQWRIKA
jgi:hypothetical protein